MPAPIVIRNLSPETKMAANPGPDDPLIATKADLRDGSRGAVEQTPAGVIFQESFDDQPDWTSTMHSTVKGQSVDEGDILPDDWHAIYQGTFWSPETGHPDNHATCEILSANSDKARGGTGKSAVFWRESRRASMPENGETVQAGSWIRVFQATAKNHNESKTTTVTTSDGTYTFTTTTVADGGTPDYGNPSATILDTDLNDRLDVPVHHGVYSNPIEITTTGPVSLDNGDFQVSPDQGGDWSGWSNWASDAQFINLLPNDHNELYIEFYIRFSENWYQRGLPVDVVRNFSSKMFRIGHWTRQGSPYNSRDGQVGPRFFWYYKMDNYGVRNTALYECGPPSSNYNMETHSRNYVDHTKGQAPGGADPQHQDQLYGGNLCDYNGLTVHEQVFGASGHWTKMAFYVKMNSAPGVADGVLKQWINDERILVDDDISWVVANAGNEMVGWNFFVIGGNDNFQPLPNEEQFEDWWSADDITVSTTIPEGLE